MNIYFKRHDKVNFKWNKKYTSTQFNNACKQYDEAPIIETLSETTRYTVDKVYISNLSRTEQTFAKLKMDVLFEKLTELDEVPIKAFKETKRKFPTVIWMLMGRIQWKLNIGTQPETQHQTTLRVDKFLQDFLIENQNILIIGHGFYFTVLRKRLLKQGFKTDKNKIRLKNGETIKFSK